MIRSCNIDVSVGYYGPYRSAVKPRDLKALAAMLNALADSPETVETRVGPFNLRLEVVDESM